jgi:TonB family protein
MARPWRALVLTLFAALSLGAAALSQEAPPDDVGESDPRVAFCMAQLAAAHVQGKASPEVSPSSAESDEKAIHPSPPRAPVTLPRFLRRVMPQYSEELRKANIEGKVVVETIIDEHGCVTNARVLESPDPRFSPLAIDSVARSVFEPATSEGRPVKVYYTQTVNFKIEHKPRAAAAALAADEPPPAAGYADARVAYCAQRLAEAHARGKVTPEAPAGPEPKRLSGHNSSPSTGSSQVTRPSLIYRVAPQYPADLRRAQAAGKVTVEAIIDEHGCIDDAHVVESPAPGFSTSALETVARWVFQPAMYEGRPVKVYYTLTINFGLDYRPPRP